NGPRSELHRRCRRSTALDRQTDCERPVRARHPDARRERNALFRRLGTVMTSNRILPVVYNDRESEARTPSQPLVVIPAEARDDFSAMPPLRTIGATEADLTRLAPGRPLAAGRQITISGRILDEDQRPVRRSVIEIWNANTYGRYSHE